MSSLSKLPMKSTQMRNSKNPTVKRSEVVQIGVHLLMALVLQHQRHINFLLFISARAVRVNSPLPF